VPPPASGFPIYHLSIYDDQGSFVTSCDMRYGTTCGATVTSNHLTSRTYRAYLATDTPNPGPPTDVRSTSSWVAVINGAGISMPHLTRVLQHMSTDDLCLRVARSERQSRPSMGSIGPAAAKCQTDAQAGLSKESIISNLILNTGGAAIVWLVVNQWYDELGRANNDALCQPGPCLPPPPAPCETESCEKPMPFAPAPTSTVQGIEDFDNVADVQGLADNLKRKNLEMSLQLAEEDWRLIARQCLWFGGHAGVAARSSCEKDPIFVSGRDYYAVTDHVITALTGGAPGTHWQLPPPTPSNDTLHPPTSLYVQSGVDAWPAWVRQNWEGSAGKPGEGWYAERFTGNYQHPECIENNQAGSDCDEFPNMATEQGGRAAPRTPHMASVESGQNRGHGSKFGANSCNLQPGQSAPDPRVSNKTGGSQFLYVPVAGSAASVFPTVWLCNEG